jgi:hypothetical protein
MTENDQLLSYQALADLIERSLGERPSLVTLRAAVSRARSGKVTDARATNTGRLPSSLTAGLPAPVTGPGGRVAGFDPDQIQEWLQEHPRRRQGALTDEIGSTKPGAERDEVIRRARAAGMSWEAIAAAVGAADGRTYTKQWAQQTYGRPSADRSES